MRLRLTRLQWQAITAAAESQGKSFREFLRQRLLKAVADVMDGDGGGASEGQKNLSMDD